MVNQNSSLSQVVVSSAQALRIAVVGVGGIGSAFAFQLARNGGHAVMVIARPNSPRLEQLQHANAIVDANGERAAVSVQDSLDENTPYEAVIVTVQSHRIHAVLPALQRSGAKCIVFMFNNFDPEELQKQLGAHRCCFGMPFIQAIIRPDGRLKMTIGAGGQRTKLDRTEWVDVFNAAGLPAVLEPDMLLWLRCHAPLCIAFESISVAGVQRGHGASWSDALRIARGARESFALIQALGYQLYPVGKARLNAIPSWVFAAMLWSLSRIKSFRELLATGSDESRALVDAIVASIPQAKSRSPLAKYWQ